MLVTILLLNKMAYVEVSRAGGEVKENCVEAWEMTNDIVQGNGLLPVTLF